MRRYSQNPSRHAGAMNASSGFTLIEMMAVMVILAILMTYLITSMGGTSDVVHGKNTRMFLDQVESLLVDYESNKGDFPPSTFPANLAEMPSTTNMGSEMLFLSLFPADGKYQAADLPEDRLCNTDNDHSKKPLSSYASGEVFEVADDWGNPIAYLHRRDYGKRFQYLANSPETGESLDGVVQALKSSKTGEYYQRKRFQLISAGADGIFGNEDDVTNFEVDTP